MKKRDLYYERIPTKLLREDIRFLGTFLGKVIKDQEGEAFFKIVERLRLLSKNTLLDKQKSKVFLKISKEIKKLSPELTFKITRAFLHILNLILAAMAILVHAIRLNVLEFSGHLGLEWIGVPYKPFRKAKS